MTTTFGVVTYDDSFAVWKLQKFSVIQFLREIKVAKSRVSKFAIFAYLEALNFDFHEILHFLKSEIC